MIITVNVMLSRGVLVPGLGGGVGGGRSRDGPGVQRLPCLLHPLFFSPSLGTWSHQAGSQGSGHLSYSLVMTKCADWI